jgi:hypothetical protein
MSFHRLFHPLHPCVTGCIHLAGLQYGRDVTSWLLQTHVKYAVGSSVDLGIRVKDLNELVSSLSGLHWSLAPAPTHLCVTACLFMVHLARLQMYIPAFSVSLESCGVVCHAQLHQ